MRVVLHVIIEIIKQHIAHLKLFIAMWLPAADHALCAWCPQSIRA